ncbi:MAG: hypothetical protein Q7J14_02075 [Candidatus Magasanikbacteria bacterium]|nr:hypothetical protein [Candidatus Magasanikbacteria bacterium]
MATNNKNYEWFIEPLNSDTNESFSDYLNSKGERIDLLPNLIDNKGKGHSCYRVPYTVVNHINKLRLEILKFKVYNREKNSGPIREWTLFKKKISKKAREVREAIKKLKK